MALSDWVLRRLFKVFLKRNLGLYIATELDPEQLSVQLERGCLELKECLLDAAYLNSQLGTSAFKIESVLLGRVSVSLFPPCILVEDAVVTLALQATEPATPADRARQNGNRNADSAAGFAGQDDIFEAASGAVGEGVKLISGAVQKLVQKIKVEGRGLVVRIKLPNEHVLTLKLDSALVQDTSAGENEMEVSWDVAKECSFSGLAVRLASSAADASVDEVLASIGSREDGCIGSVAVAWNFIAQGNGIIEVRTSFENGVSVWVSPGALPVITAVLETAAKPHPIAPHPSNHPLSKSIMAASEAAASNDIVRALQLPDGEHVLEELAHVSGLHVEEDVDEFFDAVSDLMAQSFFSTASSIFFSPEEPGEAEEAMEGDLLFPLHEHGQDSSTTEEEVLTRSRNPTIQVHVDMPTLDFWIACSSPSVTIEPWYLRVQMHQLLVAKEPRAITSLFRIEVTEVEVSEYTPTCESLGYEATRQREVLRCTAIMQALAKHSSSASPRGLFQDKNPFANTIQRLEKLSKQDQFTDWSLPDDYEMSPLIAITAAEGPALGISVESVASASSKSSLQIKLLLQHVFVWIDALFITRLQSFVSSLAFGSDDNPVHDGRQILSLEASIIASSVLICMFVPPKEAIALQLMQTSNVTRALSHLNKGGSSWNDDLEPLCNLVAGENPLFSIRIDSGRIFHAADVGVSTPSFDIENGGSAVGLCISCRPKEISSWEVTSERLPVNLPDDFAIDEGLSWNGFEIDITGDLRVKLSPQYLMHFQSLASAASVFSDETVRAGGAIVQMESFKLELTAECGGVLVDCNALRFAYISEYDGSNFGVGSLNHFALHRNKANVHTLESEFPVIIFAFKRPLKGQTSALFGVRGVVIEEDFLAQEHFWSHFNKFSPSTDQRTSNGLSMQVTGENILVLHNPSKGSESRFGAAQLTESFTMSTKQAGKFEVRIKNASLYLRQGGEFPSPFSLQSSVISAWLSKTGFRLVGSEQELRLERGFSADLNGKLTESILAESQFLRIVLSRDTTSLLRTLVHAQGTQPESSETVSPDPSRAMEEEMQGRGVMEAALTRDIRSGNQQSDEFAALDAGWYDTGLREPDIITLVDSLDSSMNRAQIQGNGVWIQGQTRLSRLYISEYVPEPKELLDYTPGGGNQNATADRIVTVKTGKICVALVDALSAPGIDVLEGSFELQLQEFELSITNFNGIGISQHYVGSLGRITARHDIHPQAGPGVPWQEVLSSPYLRKETQALKFSLQLVDSQSGEPEWRTRITCSPVFIRLEQHCVAFLREFFTFVNLDPWQLVDDEDEEMKPTGFSFIQSCDVDGFAVTFSYKPSRFNVQGALRGSLVEVLNMMPEIKASLWLRELRLRGIDSLPALGTIAAARWLEDILNYQMQKFFVTLPGVKSVYRAGTAARKFATLPQTASKKADFNKQLRRAVVALARAFASESRDVSATVAGALRNR